MLGGRMKHIMHRALVARTAKLVTEIDRRKIWTDQPMRQKTETERFLALFPDIVSLASKTEQLKDLPEVGVFVKKFLEYNSAGGKKTRGLMTVTAYQMLEKPENLTEESLRQARTLGWCVELLQTCMLLLDDIIDNSSTRRGFDCWYRLPDVGIRAVNDSSLLLALIFANLKHNFGDKQYYSKLLNVFNETILHMTIGQHLDCVSARNVSLFTEKNYSNISNFKTAYYTFKLPVYASLLLANKSYEGAYKNEEDVLSEMGILTLMQNDFMDCFVSESDSGKAGTDIQEGKCTWLAVTALQRCDAAQRAEFESCYGSADAARVQRVKRLYERLQLPTLYRDAERTVYNNIVTRIEAIPPDNVIPPALTRKLFDMAFQICDKTTEIKILCPNRSISISAVTTRHSEEEKFHDVFPEIVSSIVQRKDTFLESYGVGSFIKQLLEYNSAGGNKTRGLMTVRAYQMIEKPEYVTEESMKLARILGWYAEMLQTSLVLMDDIIDNSSTRRGSLCWYRLPHIGVRAINDSIIFLGVLHDSMKANFGNELWYPRLLDYFNESMLHVALGQHMDFTSLRKYDFFTMENYNAIANSKITHYTFKTPIYCALMLANKPHEDAFRNIEDIVTDMGTLIMMQNDYMDCFGDEAVTGKAGTDIEEGKCTWLAVTALQRCDAAQRAEFEACYGSADAARVQRVKQLYEHLQLPTLYHDAERVAYQNIVTRLQALPSDNVIPSAVMLKLLDMMYYMRSKAEKSLVD